ncbi:glycosyltransferase family 2 protein [Scandinavium lactucae]|uniref:Glycosyltransferase family 2 protein n=1 Tax=Scandinavium lactucae TaxID=3095028 RepID=A0ABU4QV44_9ENTR|nr:MULTISPECIES: glycosyltransferase family 2 protein [unclassified Scandinavium]MDX6042204.1 glycosyltransferase family 2 protein [Scandinavium sp. V105_6]MDX6052205.1 glycosyltransferase family 2 protein [Scandinavium sp. V105_1]
MRLSLVVPVYNEEASIDAFYDAVRALPAQDYQLEIVFINDGSKDGTQKRIIALQQHDSQVRLINLSRNFGKEAALFAGLEYAQGEAMIPIDVDLQDPVDLIPLLVEKWQQGADMVLAKRVDRHSDRPFKRFTARGYYLLHNVLSREKIEENVGDFRLMSRSTVRHILDMPERTLFMKGLMSWVGGRVAIVEYSRPARTSGSSKFNGWSLWNFAMDGITSFSTLPLRVWTYLGMIIAAGSLLYGVWIIIAYWLWGNSVAGYSSIMVVLLFLGGVQLIGIGVLGEYVGRIFTETKRRPRYIIDSILPEPPPRQDPPDS